MTANTNKAWPVLLFALLFPALATGVFGQEQSDSASRKELASLLLSKKELRVRIMLMEQRVSQNDSIFGLIQTRIGKSRAQLDSLSATVTTERTSRMSRKRKERITQLEFHIKERQAELEEMESVLEDLETKKRDNMHILQQARALVQELEEAIRKLGGGSAPVPE